MENHIGKKSRVGRGKTPDSVKKKRGEERRAVRNGGLTGEGQELGGLGRPKRAPAEAKKRVGPLQQKELGEQTSIDEKG